jgi:hypothetical protein
MQLIYQIEEKGQSVEVYYSDIKARYTVLTSEGDSREFLTEPEAIEYSEKFLIGAN